MLECTISLTHVNPDRRRELARTALDGYHSGPDAPIAARAAALALAKTARSVVLVEGISDQIALETLAGRRQRDLHAEGIVIIPAGGVQAVARYIAQFGPAGAGHAVAGMCDEGEEEWIRDGLRAAAIGSPHDRSEMERLGFFACVRDLEDELIRAAGRDQLEALLTSQGDLGSFRTLQNQPAWRQAAFEDQIHRWMKAGARRSLRFAGLITASLDIDRVPRPLEAVLAAV